MLKFFTCFFLTIALVFAVTNCSGRSQAQPEDNYIRVDQFGYRPQDPKVAVIVDPEVGFNAEEEVSPGTTYEVWDADSEQKVYSGTIAPWMDGQVHSQSGDRAWWFDFSEVTTPGSYYVFDAETGERSFEFDIAEDVYRDILVAATRTFFYQRSGFAKEEPYADPRWTDGAAFLGPGQDTEARFVYDKENPELARDVRGGWFDAGDTNKYVTFASKSVHQLLTAYSENPAIWTDDFNIPESGNNIPDLIDEIKYEFDWLMRMQDDDGGVFIKVGTLDFDYADRPSLDDRPRYYGPKSSAASISAAAMFAHAALVFGEFPALEAYAEELQERAIAAWDWYQTNPKTEDVDDLEIKAGDADVSLEEQEARSVVASSYLFALTGEAEYEDNIRENLDKTQPFLDYTWSRYRPFEGDALLFEPVSEGLDARTGGAGVGEMDRFDRFDGQRAVDMDLDEVVVSGARAVVQQQCAEVGVRHTRTELARETLQRRGVRDASTAHESPLAGRL